MRLPSNPEAQIDAILERMPQPRTIRLVEQNMQTRGMTIEEVESMSSDIPDDMRAAIADGTLPDLGEDPERMHRRLFIALNWRNN